MITVQAVLAKPTGVPPIMLVDHTNHLREQFRLHIEPRHKFARGKYRSLAAGSDLSALTLEAIQWHDAGKKHPQWQSACQMDYAVWRAWHDAGRTGNEPRGKRLMNACIRHEMASLDRLRRQTTKASPIVQAAIAAHHGKLSRYHRQRWLDDCGGLFKPLWKYFNGLSDEIDGAAEFDRAVLRRYEYAGPRAWLQLADHRASAAEAGRPLPDFYAFSYRFPADWTKRGVQKTVSDFWDEPLALLRAPTGAGKTDAALLWAQRQVDQDRADRLVIAMPTRFTANSLAINDAETMSRRGLYHSSAWYQRLLQAKGPSKEARDLIDAEQDMARLLETPVTVTTIDHLCMSLTGTREDHHAIFFNLAHSCVVIDEADFYDDFTQANLVILLRSLRLLAVPVLIMSATLPESCRALYDAPKVFEDVSDSQRVRCRLNRHRMPVVKPGDIEVLLRPALCGRPTIVYANTIQRAQRYYQWFMSRGMAPSDIVLYHSRFTEPDKVDIEDRLRMMLGKEAWESNQAHGVAILTQIGELSVNISADYMVSDLCPLDRLVQRVGRLARFSTAPGELHVVMPHKRARDGGTRFYPAPYGSYKTGVGWQAAPALEATDVLLKNANYSAADFTRLVNTLYPDLPEVKSHVRLNQDRLCEAITMNWLIQPIKEVGEDADQTNEWKCRDIDPQVTVFVRAPFDSQFDDPASQQWLKRREWRRYVLETGIACRTYELNRAIDQGCVTETTIAVGGADNFDHEKIWIARPEFYDSALGLCFVDPEDED